MATDIAAAPAQGDLTPKQEAFIATYEISMSAAHAYRTAYDCAAMSEAAIRVEGARLLKHPVISLRVSSLAEATQQMALEASLANVERTQKLAAIADDVENETAARLAVAERAIRTQHEVAGTIRSGQGVTVNVDARSVDGGSLSAWNEPGPDGLTGAERFRASQARTVEPGT